MITKKELQDYARLKGLTLGNAEKDYLIDIALLSISRHTKNELIFKGGTCLYKFYNLNRFSEDLDFSTSSKINIDNLVSNVLSDFEKFGVKSYIHSKKEQRNSILVNIRLEGPLFSGKSATYSSIEIDINFKSTIDVEPEFKSYNSSYPNIAGISLLCMNLEEIFAEKIRALITRARARDLFDINFLLNKNIHADKKLINKKMEYYNKEFNLKELIQRIKLLEKRWESELSGFVSEPLSFNLILKEVVKKLKNYYK